MQILDTTSLAATLRHLEVPAGRGSTLGRHARLARLVRAQPPCFRTASKKARKSSGGARPPGGAAASTMTEMAR